MPRIVPVGWAGVDIGTGQHWVRLIDDHAALAYRTSQGIRTPRKPDGTHHGKDAHAPHPGTPPPRPGPQTPVPRPGLLPEPDIHGVTGAGVFRPPSGERQVRLG